MNFRLKRSITRNAAPFLGNMWISSLYPRQGVAATPSRRLKVKEELFRSCPVLSPPSPGVQEGSKGVGWALWVVQVVMVQKISGLLKN